MQKVIFIYKNKIMKTKILKNKLGLYKYLMFLPFLLLSYCQVSNESIEIDTAESEVITKDSKVVSLLKSAMKSDDDDDHDDDDDDDDDQCVTFQYPFALDVIFGNSQSIETIIINNDTELFAFFDTLTSTDEIRFDFPLVFVGADGNSTTVNSVAELEETLQIAVDSCDDDDDDDDEEDLPYCDDNENKVYICHKGNTICVSVNAIQAHLDHGDSLGECDDD